MRKASALAFAGRRFIMTLNDVPEVRRAFVKFQLKALSLTYSLARNDKAKPAKELDHHEKENAVTEHLVPNRQCGGCTICCNELTINEPEIKKLPGILCKHCSGGMGCAIYEARPPVCRTWYCGGS